MTSHGYEPSESQSTVCSQLSDPEPALLFSRIYELPFGLLDLPKSVLLQTLGQEFREAQTRSSAAPHTRMRLPSGMVKHFFKNLWAPIYRGWWSCEVADRCHQQGVRHGAPAMDTDPLKSGHPHSSSMGKGNKSYVTVEKSDKY